MKTWKQISILFAVLALVAGCSKSKSQDPTNTNIVNNGNIIAIAVDPNAPASTTNTTTTYTTNPIYSTGSVSSFVPVSLAVMNTYVATHPLNNPSNFKISINLAPAANSRYGGQVSISYVDNGLQYNGVFKSGMGKNQSHPGMYDNDRLESDFNFWFNYNSQTVFSGFFEDQYGAITVTLVPENAATTNNDGAPITAATYKGYVYFKNFTVTGAPHPELRSCWYVYLGPYDCRSNIIQAKGGLFPGSEAGYQLLGTFSGVDIKKGFSFQ